MKEKVHHWLETFLCVEKEDRNGGNSSAHLVFLKFLGFSIIKKANKILRLSKIHFLLCIASSIARENTQALNPDCAKSWCGINSFLLLTVMSNYHYCVLAKLQRNSVLLDSIEEFNNPVCYPGVF